MTKQREEFESVVPEGTVLGTEKPVHYGGRPFLWLSRPNVSLQKEVGCQQLEPSHCLGPGTTATTTGTSNNSSFRKPKLPSEARGHQRRRSPEGDDVKVRGSGIWSLERLEMAAQRGV